MSQENRIESRVNSSVEGRKAFERYIKAFNGQDTDTFTSFYTEDVELKLGTGLLKGPKGIAAFYKKMYERVTEGLVLHQQVIDDNGIAIEITATFTAHEDAPDFQVMPIPKGHKIWGRMMVMYTLKDGKMASVRVARMGPIEGPVPA